MAEGVSGGGGGLDMPDFSPRAGCQTAGYRLLPIAQLPRALPPRDSYLPRLRIREVIGRPFGELLA
jgi:hypothetical protein